MALTITPVSVPATADIGLALYDVTFDSSYPASGYPVTPSSFGRKQTVSDIISVQKGTANRVITYDTSQAVPTLRIWTALGTEAATSSDQSAISCRCLVIGPAA